MACNKAKDFSVKCDEECTQLKQKVWWFFLARCPFASEALESKIVPTLFSSVNRVATQHCPEELERPGYLTFTDLIQTTLKLRNVSACKFTPYHIMCCLSKIKSLFNLRKILF